jgi:hypothetical protein
MIATPEIIEEMNDIRDRLFMRISGVNTEHIRGRIREAYREYDIDTLRVYQRVLKRDSYFTDIDSCIETFYAIGKNLSELMPEHIEARARVRSLMARTTPQYFEQEEPVAQLLLVDLKREARIALIITERRTVDAKEIRSLLEVMDELAAPLTDGAL